jgi:hypothetical protein
VARLERRPGLAVPEQTSTFFSSDPRNDIRGHGLHRVPISCDSPAQKAQSPLFSSRSLEETASLRLMITDGV